MKTHDEIKKGLDACKRDGDCDRGNCPYHNLGSGTRCIPAMSADARAYIQQLEAQVPKWISVKERLPETSGRYLVCISCPRGEWIESNRYDDSEHAWEADAPDYHECSTDYVTHWMPLPELPKEG